MLTYYKKSAIFLFKVAAVLLFPLRLHAFLPDRRQRHVSTPEKILIQDGYRLGDYILLGRALKHLRENFPDSCIDMLCHPAGVDFLKSCSFVDTVIPFRPYWAKIGGTIGECIKCIQNLRKNSYDLAIDFRGDPRGVSLLYLLKIPDRISFSDFGASPFCTKAYRTPVGKEHQMVRSVFLAEQVTGVKCSESKKPVWPGKTDYQKVRPSIKVWKNDGSHRILIHPCASNTMKQWPVENFAELIDGLLQKEMQVVLIGSERDKDRISSILKIKNLKQNCNEVYPDFEMLPSIVQSADTIICLDSFIQHVAWVFNKRILVLYGPGTPRYTAPPSEKVTVLWNNTALQFPFDGWNGPRDISTISADMILKQV